MSIRPDETNELQMENAALRKKLTTAESRAASLEQEVARLRGENERLREHMVMVKSWINCSACASPGADGVLDLINDCLLATKALP